MLSFTTLQAQQADSLKNYGGVLLSEVLIKELQSQFDPSALIQRMQTDTTFYKAFKTLRLQGFDLYTDIEVLNNTDEVTASYNSQTRQIRQGRCRQMQTLHETVKGPFFDWKGNYRYRTAELYAHLFFTRGKVCGGNNIVGTNQAYTGTAKY
ncbi:MAG: hypothetical protein FGM54_11060, partial [Chitinophagaceae bacterium]|nr:hypothetical protein [Chitinophagaceae bacterium]